MFDTVGHHVFENRQLGDENKAPFFCTSVNSFLGKGYYYWDDHLPFAKVWGGIWYKDNRREYFVLESTISTEYEYFFDLVGNREHQKYIVEVDNYLKEKRPEKANWPLGKVIEFLKAASKDYEGYFANKFKYKLIRAADKDYSQLAKKEKLFSSLQRTMVSLNPCYILCVIDKNGCIHDSRIVHSSKKKE